VSRRQPLRPHPLTRQHARQARAQGRAARARQAHTLGRATPASRTPDYIEVKITTRLVRAGARVIDRDPALFDWLRERLDENQKGPGRPSALSVRSGLVCFWLLAVTQRNFHIINLAALVDSMSWRVRRQLGIDYITANGEAKQVSYHQLLRLFHAMADALDPYATDEDDKPLSEHEARHRAAMLQELVNRLVWASAGVAHGGHYAVDATLKWSHERPRSGVSNTGNKIPRRGKDEEAGPPLPLSAVIETADIEDLEADAGLVRDPLEPEHRKPSRYRLKTWSGGADWVGRRKRNGTNKGVFGYALHTLSVTDPTVPNVIDGMALTTAKALPAPSITPVLRAVYNRRSAADQPMGDIVADGVYSANVADWQLPLRAMGATPWFKLHKRNQAGIRPVRDCLFIDGRPVCPCAAYAIEHRDFPIFPYKAKDLAAYQDWAAKRARFELKPNGGFRADGGRQFFTLHHSGAVAIDTGAPGGCYHCVDTHGDPVIDPLTRRPRPRCCTQRTHLFYALELGLYQEESFGTEEWFDRWNRPNRVEGSYGILKNLALVNWGRDYHHFVGLARESIVAAFAIMAYNFRIERTWAAMAKLLAEKNADGERIDRDMLRTKRREKKRLKLPSAQPTMTMPARIPPPPDVFSPLRGPKGREALGQPPP